MARFISWRYILLTAMSLLLTRENGAVNAKLTVSTIDNTTVTYSTYDYFSRHSPYYHYSNVGVLWPWKTDTTNCTLEHGQWIEKLSNKTIDNIGTYDNMTIVVDTSSASHAGCMTIAQIGVAMEVLSNELVGLKMPPIKLFILLSNPDISKSNSSLPEWGPGCLWYWTNDHTHTPDGPPSMNVALVDKPDALSILSSLHGTLFFHFDIEQEPGMWNKLYLSTGYVAYKWICFIVAGATLLYAHVRFFMLLWLGVQPKGIRLFIFIISSIATIFYLMMNRLTMNTRLFQVISTTASFTFVCALNAVLLQWTFYSQALFSRTTILCFRAVVIILFIPDVISYVLAIIMSTIRHIDIGEEILYVISNYIGFTMQIVNVITYSGLAIFFGYSAHRLRRHDKPRTRFALLTVFTIIVFISDVITLTESIITSYFDKMNVVLSHKRWFAFSAMGHLEFVSYSIACLIILGVCYQGCNNAQGPRQHKPPLGGMTTIEYEPSVKDIDITVVVGSNTERDLFRPPQRPRCHSSSVKSEKTIIEIA